MAALWAEAQVGVCAPCLRAWCGAVACPSLPLPQTPCLLVVLSFHPDSAQQRLLCQRSCQCHLEFASAGWWKSMQWEKSVTPLLISRLKPPECGSTGYLENITCRSFKRSEFKNCCSTLMESAFSGKSKELSSVWPWFRLLCLRLLGKAGQKGPGEVWKQIENI